MLHHNLKHFPLLLALVFSSQAFADTVADDFTQPAVDDSTTTTGNGLNWKALGTAGNPCLTAGTAANNQTTTPGAAHYSNIPGCNWGSPDTAGSGALQLTPAAGNQAGAIVSQATFPSNQGLQVTFTTYTYHGNGGGKGSEGADGIGFFLQDGSVGTTVGGVDNIGAYGGSLGYSCSQSKGAGLTGAYLGLGMDEYGNFLNMGDNTATGIPIQDPGVANGGNTFHDSVVTPGDGSGPYYQSNRIGLRGAGNVSWYWLNANYAALYPSSLSTANKLTAVKNTCQTGTLWDYSGAGVNTGATTSGGGPTLYDYAVIPGGYYVLPAANLIANESAATRSAATPITYRLIITPGGLLSFMYSYNGGAYSSVLTNWQISTSNGPVPDTFRFGFAASTGGSNNIHEISCFEAAPVQSTSSAGANTVQSGQVRTGTQVYLASYNPNGWSGTLLSKDIVNTAGVLSVSSTANWDASCVLTGGDCPNTGASSVSVEAPADRQLLTWDGSAGVPLAWTGGITGAQQTVLNSTDSKGQDRLNWLRGDRTKEQGYTPAGPLRTRGSVLGDIVDSSPVWVGPPSLSYTSPFNDTLYPSATQPENDGSAQAYSAYASSMAARVHVVYSGSNDGLLHGFETGHNDSGESYNSSDNKGYELIGFMPSTVLANANVVGLTNPTYGHNYFVDAAPGTGDLFYNNAWHTWLVGGIGPGGAEIYALDVTDPTGLVTATSKFLETNAANLVKGDWTPSSLTALGCVHATSNCGKNLHNTYGTPKINRLHNGTFAIIFGNGLPTTITSLSWASNVLTVTTGSNHGYAVGDTVTFGGSVTDSNSVAVNGSRTITSVLSPSTFTVGFASDPGTFSNVSSGTTTVGSNNTAGVFIGLVDASTGAISSFYWLDTLVGSSSSPDGIAYVSPADMDGDHVIDYLYAGDLKGNVWRFDVTSSNPADWGVSTFGNGSATPLFTATSSTPSAHVQPITTQIAVTATIAGGQPRVILGFGTGRAIPFTTTTGVTYAPGQQTAYGIWDWDMTLWNNGTTTASLVTIPASTAHYAALAGVSILTRANLFQNSSSESGDYRTMAISNVGWCGSSTCTSPSNQYGWYYDLPDSVTSSACGGSSCYEQVIYSPAFAGGELIFNSTIPATTTTGQCSPPLPSGWTNVLDMASGGGALQNIFADASGSYTVTPGNNSITGSRQGSGGTPRLYSIGSSTYIVDNTGKVKKAKLQPSIGVTTKTWEEIR